MFIILYYKSMSYELIKKIFKTLIIMMINEKKPKFQLSLAHFECVFYPSQIKYIDVLNFFKKLIY